MKSQSLWKCCCVHAVVKLSARISLELRINTGKRTEWSPIWSLIVWAITKSDNLEVGVRFVNHEYDLETDIRRHKVTYQLIILDYNFWEARKK